MKTSGDVVDIFVSLLSVKFNESETAKIRVGLENLVKIAKYEQIIATKAAIEADMAQADSAMRGYFLRRF